MTRLVQKGAVIGAGLAFASMLVPNAWATPLLMSYHTVESGVSGTLTAGLDVWRRPYTIGGNGAINAGSPILVDHLIVGPGNDFTVFVPPAVVNAPWTATIPNYPGLGASFWGAVGFNLLYAGTADTVDALGDLCSTGGAFGVNRVFDMAKRGNCTFAAKVTNMQSSFAAGAIIVGTDPAAGAQDISLGSLVPDIPVMFMSFGRGAQILQLQTEVSVFAPNLGRNILIPENQIVLDFSATWTPDIQAIPEPGLLGFLGLGATLLCASRRTMKRRNRPRFSR